MPDDLPKWDEPRFWTARGCVMLGGVFVSILSVAVAVTFAIHDGTTGLLLVSTRR